MWVQLKSIKHIPIRGKPATFYPGDWVEVGKQTALQWLADGTACQPEFAGKGGDLIGISTAHIYTDDAAVISQRLKAYQHMIPIKGSNIQMSAPKIIYWSAAVNVRPAALVIGLGLVQTWEIAVPLMDYKTLAAHAGEDADREMTHAVVRDLRVPLYDTRLMFLRSCENTTRLIARWQTEPGDRSLAFLRALYETKPLVLALPCSWVGVNV